MIRRTRAFLQKPETVEAWNSFLKDTIHTRFFREGVHMSFWRILSLVFGAIASIWAARCLGPENFGVSGMIVSTCLQLALFVNLNQYASYIRLYKTLPTEEDRKELISAIFTFRWTVSLLIIFLAIPVALWLRLPPKWDLPMIAGVFYFLFLVNVADWILSSDGKNPQSYQGLTVQAMTAALLCFLFIRPGAPAGYDLAAQSVGLFFSNILVWYYAVNGRKIRLYQWRLLPRMVAILKQGRWLALMGFVVYIYTALESPLLGYLYSVKEAGTYRAATSLVAGCQAMLQMIPTLLYPRYIEWGKQGPAYLWSRQKKIALTLFALFLPISLTAFLVSPIFYHYAYSPKFERAAIPFALLLTARLTNVIGSTFSFGLYANHQDKLMLYVMSVVSVISLALNLIFIPRYGVMAAASMNLTSETLIMTGACLLCRRYVRLHSSGLQKSS